MFLRVLFRLNDTVPSPPPSEHVGVYVGSSLCQCILSGALVAGHRGRGLAASLTGKDTGGLGNEVIRVAHSTCRLGAGYGSIWERARLIHGLTANYRAMIHAIPL